MIPRSAAGFAIRAGAIVALIATCLAVALVAWETQRMVFAPGPLYIALGLLLIGIAAIILIALAVVQAAPPPPEGNPAQGAAPIQPDPTSTDTGPIPPLPVQLARVGHLMSIGSLIRGFCHELNNELAPVQGYSELLAGDMRLSELHRRQAARIRDATKTALADIRSFGAALGWSADPAHITRLGDMASEAARSAQTATTTRIEVDVPGAEVEVTATEAEVGQAILHVCAAAQPLLSRQDAPIRIQVDSIVGASTVTSDDLQLSGHWLEIWSDPADQRRTKLQFGTLRPSWRYGRVRIGFKGQGWPREQVGRLFALGDTDEVSGEATAMTLLGILMIETNGVVMLDTSPEKQTQMTLLWPARISPEVGAPLELDAQEDELDALVIHTSEIEAEALSRRLTDLGLKVASTTSTDAALELIAEMGPKCHAVVLAQASEDDVVERLRRTAARPRIFRFDALPDGAETQRLAAELRRTEAVT